ncbi:MarR family winged helix-turn-helix transcriptional regulator [Catenuloplanes indicus]|uniref:DNA-binding MarR family transcriptional regulator n=1 Tax=Catenuloplanes indicus TaxID=137267 RepID=A0AAE4B1P3_9ACTN|nr:MarR family winged helix-turn-helix transcriptional regulator [Catenuloplanes indicus]MDQ0369811.1 DNA-binding MarR family transcriptional regulator [Catenuloplanes indicus]
MDLELSQHHLAAGLARVAVAVRAADDDAPAAERTLAQQQVLLVLRRRDASCPLSELSKDLGMTTKSLLAAVETLVAEGLVAMGPAPSFSPAEMRLSLTEAGRAEPAEPMNWAADLLNGLHDLDALRRQHLLDVVTTKIRTMQAADQIPITKMCVTCRFFESYAYPGSGQPHHCWLVGSPFGHLDLRLRCPEAKPGEAMHVMLAPRDDD